MAMQCRTSCLPVFPEPVLKGTKLDSGMTTQNEKQCYSKSFFFERTIDQQTRTIGKKDSSNSSKYQEQNSQCSTEEKTIQLDILWGGFDDPQMCQDILHWSQYYYVCSKLLKTVL